MVALNPTLISRVPDEAAALFCIRRVLEGTVKAMTVKRGGRLLRQLLH